LLSVNRIHKGGIGKVRTLIGLVLSTIPFTFITLFILLATKMLSVNMLLAWVILPFVLVIGGLTYLVRVMSGKGSMYIAAIIGVLFVFMPFTMLYPVITSIIQSGHLPVVLPEINDSEYFAQMLVSKNLSGLEGHPDSCFIDSDSPPSFNCTATLQTNGNLTVIVGMLRSGLVRGNVSLGEANAKMTEVCTQDPLWFTERGDMRKYSCRVPPGQEGTRYRNTIYLVFRSSRCFGERLPSTYRCYTTRYEDMSDYAVGGEVLSTYHAATEPS
jgi:hypothetical protein